MLKNGIVVRVNGVQGALRGVHTRRLGVHVLSCAFLNLGVGLPRKIIIGWLVAEEARACCISTMQWKQLPSNWSCMAFFRSNFVFSVVCDSSVRPLPKLPDPYPQPLSFCYCGELIRTRSVRADGEDAKAVSNSRTVYRKAMQVPICTLQQFQRNGCQHIQGYFNMIELLNSTGYR